MRSVPVDVSVKRRKSVNRRNTPRSTKLSTFISTEVHRRIAPRLLGTFSSLLLHSCVDVAGCVIVWLACCITGNEGKLTEAQLARRKKKEAEVHAAEAETQPNSQSESDPHRQADSVPTQDSKRSSVINVFFHKRALRLCIALLFASFFIFG